MLIHNIRIDLLLFVLLLHFCISDIFVVGLQHIKTLAGLNSYLKQIFCEYHPLIFLVLSDILKCLVNFVSVTKCIQNVIEGINLM